MDNQDTSVIALCGLAVSILTAIIGAINHKRIRSECCGTKGQISFDIDSTSPVMKPTLELKSVPPIDEVAKP
jgi:hypothetical protein